jgi:hypothetical protein
MLLTRKPFGLKPKGSSQKDNDIPSFNIEDFGLNTLSLRGIQACGESVRLLEISYMKTVS